MISAITVTPTTERFNVPTPATGRASGATNLRNATPTQLDNPFNLHYLSNASWRRR